MENKGSPRRRKSNCIIKLMVPYETETDGQSTGAGESEMVTNRRDIKQDMADDWKEECDRRMQGCREQLSPNSS